MLTDEEVLSNKEKLISILDFIVDETFNKDAFIEFLERFNYFNAPATAQYSYAYKGGLCQYALKLAAELKMLCTAYFPDKYTDTDIVKVAIGHDIYRMFMYEFYTKSVKNDETGQWENIGAYKTAENRPVFGELGFSSYMVAKDFFDLNTEQIEAICHTSVGSTYNVDIHKIRQEFPLVVLTDMALAAITYFGD